MSFILATQNAFASDEQQKYHGIQGSMSLYARKQGDGYILYDNQKTTTISKHTYDMIYGCYAYSGCENKVVVVRSGNRFGLIDVENGEEILSPENSPVTNFADSVYAPEPLIWNIDGKTETLTSVPIHIDARWGYHSDLNPVLYYYGRNHQTYLMQPMRMGFCDKEGNEVIPPLFDRVSSFINGVSIVLKDNKVGAINTSGELILPFEYDEILEYNDYLKVFKSEDYARARLLGTLGTGSFKPPIVLYSSVVGISDRRGKIVVPCEYQSVDLFTYNNYTESETIKFIVRKEVLEEIYMCGLLDGNGNEILPVKYAYISDGSFGRYILQSTQERVGMADSKGNVIISIKYDAIYPTEVPEYIIVVQNGKHGIITPRNQILTPLMFDGIYWESAHDKIFFFAMVKGKWGRIDHNGKILLAPKYDTICVYREENDNSMIVEINEQCMRVDSKGKVIERYEKHPYMIETIDIIQPIIEYDDHPISF